MTATTTLPRVNWSFPANIKIGDTILAENTDGPVIGQVWAIERVAESYDLFLKYQIGDSNLKGWAVTRKHDAALVPVVTL